MPAKPTFCISCGQEVTGVLARAAHDPEVTHCWKCGGKLDGEGKCQTEECKYFGKVPPSPPKAPTTETFCADCGQAVKGAVAKAAHNPDITHCWKCGAKLDDEGKCPNEDCKFFGKDPGPPPTK